MSKGLVERSSLEAIANAIRTKTEDSQTYKPGEMADAILGIPTSGGGGGSGPTLIGQTPIKLTEKVDELKLTSNGECSYDIQTDTLFDFDIDSGSAVKATLTYEDGYYQLKADSSATAWYQTYIDITVTGLTVGTNYNFMADMQGITVNDSAHKTQGHYILYNGSGATLATRAATHGAGLHNYAFTADTTSVRLRWYPATNNTFQSGESIAYTKAFYINAEGTTAHTEIMVKSGTFTDETTLAAVPKRATITSSPACKVYKVPTDGGGGMPLKDRKVVCFGDSLFGMVRGDTSAPAFVESYTGATTYNVGFGGCRMAQHPTSGYAEFSMWALAKAVAENDWTSQDAAASNGSDYFPEQLAILKGINFNAVDYAVIHYGTNDFGGGVAIGQNSAATDTTTICGALRYSIEKLLGAYPRLQIFISLPIFRFWEVNGNKVYSDTYTNSQNNTLVQVVEAIRAVATEYNLPVIDGYYGLGINSTNADTFLYDGTHLNASGRQRFGEYIGSRLLYSGDQSSTVSSGGEAVWFEDRNDDVLDYLEASEVYTEENRNITSVIGNYASTSVQDQDCPKPFLGTYNLVPGTANTVGDWTVTTMGKPPRMIKLNSGWNVRDIGGWNADGGKVKFGLLFRGARLESATTDDLALLASEGVKLDLDLRDASNASGSTRIPGASYYNAALTNAYTEMIQNEASTVATACITAMQSIVNDNPVYVHCASGADRTGSICGMLEALLGMSAADIDRDYELTCFADVEQLTGRTRVGTWNSFWTTLNSGQGSQKMNVVKWLRDNGATTTLINSFRQAMIDGNPSDVDVPTFQITNNLTNCTSSNAVTSVDSGSAYTATISPNSGYSITVLTVTMGGTDITATAVRENMINITAVTGAVVITALADVVTSYTNIVRTSEALDSTAVYNGGLGYKDGYYTSVGKESAKAGDCCTGLIPYTVTSTGQPTDVLYLKGYGGEANASHTRLSLWTSAKVHKNEYNGFLSSNILFDVERLSIGYYKLTPKSGVHHSINGVGYIRFSFAGTSGQDIIITRNEPIE